MQNNKVPAKLILSDGTTFAGYSFGASAGRSGEVVFATGMTGYTEAFTDPSFREQIVVMTYPLIGNYGVPKGPFESEQVQISGLVVQEYAKEYSHPHAVQSLGQWLEAHNVPAIFGIDTRAVTKKLREHGVMLGQIVVGSQKPLKTLEDPNNKNIVAEVSPKKPKIYNPNGKKTIIAVDCGMKENTVRNFVRRGVQLKRVPWNYNYLNEEWDGLFFSNGPGDPTMVQETIAYLQEALKLKKPIFGICLGSQLMALAAGAKTYKLKYGHRSQNQPCAMESTDRCFLTTQNHGFAVDDTTLPKEWEVWFRNANDGTVEGIRHKTLPYSSVQFHPESSPGPEDTEFLFDLFVQQVNKH